MDNLNLTQNVRPILLSIGSGNLSERSRSALMACLFQNAIARTECIQRLGEEVLPAMRQQAT